MSHQETPRLVTFEIDSSETLIICAGRSEADKRTIYQGSADGRYGVVPVDELVQDDPPVPDGDPLVDEMRLVGQTVAVPEDGHTMVSLETATDHIKRMDRKGVYGLLWVPFE